MTHPSLPDVDALLERIVAQLRAPPGSAAGREDQPPIDTDTRMVGIARGGVWVARRLHQLLGLSTPLGELDITFYRDDFTRVGMHPEVRASSLPWGIDEARLVLVDDVLHTGRTVRAALNELFAYGRPGRITFAALVERDGRELPIQADVVGGHLNLGPDQYVKLAGPDDLRLIVSDRPDRDGSADARR